MEPAPLQKPSAVKLILAPMLLMPLLMSGCAREAEIVLSGPTMGTTYTVKAVAAPPDVTAAHLRETIDNVLATVDRQMSGYRPDSELSRFNASRSTDWFAVSPEMSTVVAAAQGIAERSGGALDITVAPLVALWGFGPAGEQASLPDEARLQDVRRRIGHSKLSTRAEPPAVRKDIAELSIDLNAVAPGYAVDLMIERLEALGIRNCMVDIGGEVRVLGQGPTGPWRIAVEKPADGEPEPYLILELDRVAVATSGEYRHSRMREGRRLSHSIDPRTARPVDHDLASVVVIADTALEADGWATAFNVLGSEQGYALASRLGLSALFIHRKDGELQHRATPGFERYLANAPRSAPESLPSASPKQETGGRHLTN